MHPYFSLQRSPRPQVAKWQGGPPPADDGSMHAPEAPWAALLADTQGRTVEQSGLLYHGRFPLKMFLTAL